MRQIPDWFELSPLRFWSTMWC